MSDLKILLGNRELILTSASVLRTMDTGADEWNCIVEWTPGNDPEFDRLVQPRSLTESIVSIDDKKLITGNKYVTSGVLGNKNALSLRGFSKTYRLIKSNPKAQREFIEQSLLEITAAFSLPFGLFTAVEAPEALVNEKFEKVTIAAQDTPFAFLQNLARQRGLLTSSDNDGNLFYLRAKTRQKPVGSIVEGVDGANVPVTDEFTASFDDGEVFQTYQAVNDSPLSWIVKDTQGKTTDSRIKIPSFKTVVFNSLAKGAGQKAVEFTRNQTIAQSMSMPFEVNTWRAPNGQLWQENTLVSVVSPTLFVPDGFTFLIRAVQYNLSGRGETAVLSLVPPSLFTGGDVEEPKSWG